MGRILPERDKRRPTRCRLYTATQSRALFQKRSAADVARTSFRRDPFHRFR